MAHCFSATRWVLTFVIQYFFSSCSISCASCKVMALLHNLLPFLVIWKNAVRHTWFAKYCGGQLISLLAAVFHRINREVIVWSKRRWSMIFQCKSHPKILYWLRRFCAALIMWRGWANSQFIIITMSRVGVLLGFSFPGSSTRVYSLPSTTFFACGGKNCTVHSLPSSTFWRQNFSAEVFVVVQKIVVVTSRKSLAPSFVGFHWTSTAWKNFS